MHKDYICPVDQTKWGGVDVPSTCPECAQKGHTVEGIIQAPPIEEKFEYKIVAEAKDPMTSIIEKTGQKTRFTLLEIRQDRARAAKMKEGLAGQLTVSRAKMTNIEANHPIVTDLEPVELVAIGLYVTEKAIVDQCEAKIAEFNELCKEYDKEESEITRQVGISATIEDIKKEPNP